MNDAGGDPAEPSLVVVTTEAATTQETSAWLQRQLPAGAIGVRTGFYAAMTALARPFDVVVADVGVPSARDGWRLSEMRSRIAEATLVVIADSTLLPSLVGALRPDLAVRSVKDLPPWRELVTGPATVDDQTIRRRSRR